MVICDFCTQQIEEAAYRNDCSCCEQVHCLRCFEYLSARHTVDAFEKHFHVYEAIERPTSVIGRIWNRIVNCPRS